MKRLKKLSEETLRDNPWFLYKHDQCEQNGGTADYFYVETRGMAMVIPVLRDGRIMLTLQYRYLGDKQSIEFPGGGIHEGEEPVACAARELLEETGATADELMKIGVVEPANGYAKDTMHIFIAQVGEINAPQPDASEDIEVLFRRPDEIESMMVKNEIWDGQSMAAWVLARNHFHIAV